MKQNQTVSNIQKSCWFLGSMKILQGLTKRSHADQGLRMGSHNEVTGVCTMNESFDHVLSFSSHLSTIRFRYQRSIPLSCWTSWCRQIAVKQSQQFKNSATENQATLCFGKTSVFSILQKVTADSKIICSTASISINSSSTKMAAWFRQISNRFVSFGGRLCSFSGSFPSSLLPSKSIHISVLTQLHFVRFRTVVWPLFRKHFSLGSPPC